MTNYVLSLKCSTWYKDSHSLFDYESDKTTQNNFDFPLPEKNIVVFRKKNSTNVVAVSKPENINQEEFDLLTYFRVKPSTTPGSYCLEFSNSKNFKKKNEKSERLNTDQSNESSESKEETFLVVKKVKDIQGNQIGVRLKTGQVVKLGRVQYFVSEISFGGVTTLAHMKNKISICNRTILKFEPDTKKKELNACKICLDQSQTSDNFLFNPCKCTGSCGAVHLECLQQWVHVKVKKQIIGGTVHLNYEKFECEICKSELPMIIETHQKQVQLLPIPKPKGNYMILEAACEKAKSVMLIQNLGTDGIKLGRGHECQIRITDISVSRSHAAIKMKGDGFYVFDNKSKFGTLVRDENLLQIEVDSTQQAIQIGRTFISLEVSKKRSY